MEKIEKHDNALSKIKHNITDLTSESRENLNGITDDTMKHTVKTSLYKKKKSQRIKKNIQIIPIDIKFNNSDEPCALHFVEEQNEGNTSKFPFIENASSIGSENQLFEELCDLPVTIKFIRNLDFPCYHDEKYNLTRMKHILIETLAINVLYMDIISYTKSSVFLPYCFSCQTVVRMKSKQSTITKLIRHIRDCIGSLGSSLSYMIKDEEESLKVENQFSLVQLAMEYITVPRDELKKRVKLNLSYTGKESYELSYLYQTYMCLICHGGNNLDKTQYEMEIDGSYQSLYNHITSEAHQIFKSKLEEAEGLREVINEIHATFRTEEVEKCRCELCGYENPSESDFMKHLTDTAHVMQLATESEKENFGYYYCNACLFRWFGHRDTYEQHRVQAAHQNRMSYYPYIEHIPEECLDLLKYINQNRQVLMSESDLTLDDTSTENLLYNLKKDLHTIFPKMRAHLFGSRISGLALPDSDLDIFLDCEYTYTGKITHADSQDLIKLIESELSFKKKWTIQKVVLNSRTPVIKLLHICSQINCDVTVSNGLGVEKTKMIKCFIEAYPTCRELILFVKRWLQISNQLTSNFITSYAIAWCVIYYLQDLKIFPSISHLIKLKNKSRRINGWEVGVSYNFSVGKTNRTFEELLFGFFRFYSEFDYRNYVICPLLGEEIEKYTFWNRIDMEELTPYVNYIKRHVDRHTGEKPKKFVLSAFSIQDPFDLSHNITKAMNERKLKKFRTACKYATRYLKMTLTGISSRTIEKYSYSKTKHKNSD